MALRTLWISLFSAAALLASPSNYTLGQGLQLHDMLSVGGYFSTEYEQSEDEKSFKLDDVAVMAYGSLLPSLNYLAEFEAVNFYSYNLTDEIEEKNYKFHVERLYLDYRYSDTLGARIGKEITPIGYWNLEPINVLRDTTSNPFYSQFMFPKFLTGIDINGYIPGSEGTTYHLFGQKNKDLDEEYLNIPNEHFFGVRIEHEVSMEFSVGGSVGQYEALLDTKSNFVQLNAKYDDYRFRISAEGIVRHDDLHDGSSEVSMAGYLQGLYRMSAQHALVSRAEFYDNRETDEKDSLFLVGYSYRPRFPISLKAEYQWHTLEAHDKFLASFSVLF